MGRTFDHIIRLFCITIGFLPISAVPQDSTDIQRWLDSARAYQDKNHIKAREFGEKALELSDSLDLRFGKLQSRDILSYVYDQLGDYPASQEQNFALLELYREKNDTVGMAKANNYIGIIHYYQGDFSKSLEFYERSLALYRSKRDSAGVSACLNNIANLYADNEKYEKGLAYYYKALAIDSALKDTSGMSIAYSNIGETYQVMGDRKKAKRSLLQALKFGRASNDDWVVINPLTGLGSLLGDSEDPEKALRYLQEALVLAQKTNALAEETEIHNTISSVHENAGNYKKALESHKRFKTLNDSLYYERSADKLAEMEARFKTREKEKALKLKEAQIRKQELEARHQRTLQYAMGAGLILLASLAGVVIHNNRRKKKTNQELSEKNHQIEEKNKAILDSFQYAQRIQKAILPGMDPLQENFPESFIFFEPRDIVSGDIYWYEKVGNRFYLAVMDCTGHGVPGALVSVVAHNCLQKAVLEFDIHEPAAILDKLNELVEETFQDKDEDVSDGMDMSLCCFDHTKRTVEFAGANNPLYLIRSGELEAPADSGFRTREGERDILYEFKGNDQPIGKHIKRAPFTQTELKLQKGDSLYFFSDGYADQFGGPRGKKMKYGPFKDLLLSLQDQDMMTQKSTLSEKFIEWKRDLEQVDDVCVLGVKWKD